MAEVNEVVVNGETIISLANDTATEETVVEGVTFHDASGVQRTGVAVIPTKTSQLINDSEYVVKSDLGGAVEITSGTPTKDQTVLTLNPSGGEVNIYTAQEIDAMMSQMSGGMTSIPDEYVTESELEAKGYAVQSDIKTYQLVEDDNVTSTEMPMVGVKGSVTTTEREIILKDNTGKTSTVKVISTDTTYGSATESANGLMSKEDKAKLNTLGDYAKTADHYTKTESDNKYQPKGSYLTSVPSEYVTETELSGKGYLTEHQDLSAYAKTSAIPTKVSQLTNDKNYLTAVPGEYITESELTAKKYLTAVPSEYVTETELTAKGYATQSSVNSLSEEIADYSHIFYGTCSTVADTAEKVVTVDNENWELKVGTIVLVKFDVSNTASNVKLNVNGTGAYPIWYNTAEYTSTGTGYTGYAGRTIGYMFDGTHWVWIMQSYDSNTTYTNVKLGHGYATCSTAEATTAKVGTLSSYTLTTGGIVAVKFTYGVPASATLNINSKGAKAIYYKGAKITAGVIKAGDTATFIYNGSQYHLLSIDRWQNDIDNLTENVADLEYAVSNQEETVTQNVLASLNFDVFGTVDNENNIIIENTLSGGAYFLKYENGDGTYTDIGTLQVGYVMHTILQNLTKISSNNSATTIEDGKPLTIKLTPSSGYEITSVKVTMGGVDITSSAYSNGTITIASVSGNVVITATATVPAPKYTNLYDKSKVLLNARFNSSHTVTSANGTFITHWIDLPDDFASKDCFLYLKGINPTGGATVSYSKVAFSEDSTVAGKTLALNDKANSSLQFSLTTNLGVKWETLDANSNYYKIDLRRNATGSVPSTTANNKCVVLALNISSSALTKDTLPDIIITMNEEIV